MLPPVARHSPQGAAVKAAQMPPAMAATAAGSSTGDFSWQQYCIKPDGLYCSSTTAVQRTNVPPVLSAQQVQLPSQALSYPAACSGMVGHSGVVMQQGAMWNQSAFMPPQQETGQQQQGMLAPAVSMPAALACNGLQQQLQLQYGAGTDYSSTAGRTRVSCDAAIIRGDRSLDLVGKVPSMPQLFNARASFDVASNQAQQEEQLLEALTAAAAATAADDPWLQMLGVASNQGNGIRPSSTCSAMSAQPQQDWSYGSTLSTEEGPDITLAMLLSPQLQQQQDMLAAAVPTPAAPAYGGLQQQLPHGAGTDYSGTADRRHASCDAAIIRGDRCSLDLVGKVPNNPHSINRRASFAVASHQQRQQQQEQAMAMAAAVSASASALTAYEERQQQLVLQQQLLQLQCSAGVADYSATTRVSCDAGSDAATMDTYRPSFDAPSQLQPQQQQPRLDGLGPSFEMPSQQQQLLLQLDSAGITAADLLCANAAAAGGGGGGGGIAAPAFQGRSEESAELAVIDEQIATHVQLLMELLQRSAVHKQTR